MSLRATTDHVDDYGRTHLFEIYDSEWGGGVTPLKNTGEGFGDFSHQVLDPRKPHEDPIQKGALELSVWLRDATEEQILTDIKAADEQQFYVIHYVDGSQEWQGYIYNDLTTFEENVLPFRITLMAKDFTDMGGKDYLVSGSLPDNRETVITTIAYLLNEVGFDIPIKTHTSWIEEHMSDKSQDYLRNIYHETKALRNFGKTNEETDQSISVEEALEKLCQNHRLLLKQTGGAYWIDQLTAYDDPENVTEAVYDIDGSLNTAEITKDLTVDAPSSDLKVVIDQDNRDNSGMPGLKRALVTYDHRTKVTNIQPTGVSLTDDAGETSYSDSQLFLSDGSQRIEFSIFVFGSRDGDLPSSTGQYYLKAGAYYWDQEEYEWTDNGIVWNEYELTNTTNKPGLTIWTGGVGFETDHTPEDADGELEFRVDIPTGLTQADINIQMDITNPIASENSTSIDYELTQAGGFSVEEEHADSWYGDGPVQWSVGALRHGTDNNDTTTDSWQRRGFSAFRNFHENHLKESVDVQRGWRRLLSALLKGKYYPHQILSYDSDYFYYLGGRWDIWTGNWTVEIFQLDIETASDDFDDIPKFSGDTESGTGASSNDPTTGNFNPSTYDNRWFNIQNDLAEGTPSTMRSNLGLVIGTDVQAWDANLDAIDQDLSTTATPTWPQATITNAPTTNDHIATKGYADSLISGLDWQESVIDEINDPSTVTPSSGDRYLVGESPVGDFSGHAEEIAEYDGSDWQFIIPDDATTLEIESNGFIWIWNGSNWVRFGSSISHNQLQDLDASDHLLNENDTGLAFFNASQDQFDTDADLTFDGSVLEAPAVNLVGEGAFIRLNQDGTANRSNEIQLDQGDQNWWIRSNQGSLSIRDDTTGNNRIFTIDAGAPSNSFSINSSGNTIIRNEADIQDTLTGVDASLSSTLEVGGLATFEDDIQTDNFSSGFTGAGLQATHSGDVTAGSILLRDSLRARELIFDQLGAIGGSQLISDARGKIESVDTGNSEVTLEDLNGKDATSFTVDDIFWVMAWDIDGAEIVSAEGTVTSKTNTTLTLSFDSGAIGDLSAGDVIVQRGNTTDADRQSLIYQTASDADAPFTAYYQNVDAAGDFAPSNVFAQIGVLDNLSTEHGVSGDGVFVSRGRFTDDILVGSLDKTGTYFEVDGSDLNAVMDSLDITINGSNSIVADATGVDITAETFLLSTTDLTIDSSVPKIDVGNGVVTLDPTSGLNITTNEDFYDVQLSYSFNNSLYGGVFAHASSPTTVNPAVGLRGGVVELEAWDDSEERLLGFSLGGGQQFLFFGHRDNGGTPTAVQFNEIDELQITDDSLILTHQEVGGEDLMEWDFANLELDMLGNDITGVGDIAASGSITTGGSITAGGGTFTGATTYELDGSESVLFDRTENASVDHVYGVGTSNQDAFLIRNNTDGQALARFFPDQIVEFYDDVSSTGNITGEGGFKSGTVTIADDDFAEIGVLPDSNISGLWVGFNSGSVSLRSDLIVVLDSGAIEKITDSTAEIDTSSGTPSGTTGSDNIVTVFNDGGTIYIENRDGSTRTFKYFFMA